MNKTSIKRELNSAWYELGHQRYKTCAVCGKGPVSIHHIVPKSHQLTAYDPDNQLPLCTPHHQTDKILSAHGNPAVFRSWMKEWLPDKYEYLIENEHRTAHSLPLSWYQEKLEYLKEQLKCQTT